MVNQKVARGATYFQRRLRPIRVGLGITGMVTARGFMSSAAPATLSLHFSGPYGNLRDMETVPPLRAYREKQEPPLTQDQLAELLGVSKPTVSRWETGERRVDIDLIPKISEVTGISPAELRPDLASLFRSVG